MSTHALAILGADRNKGHCKGACMGHCMSRNTIENAHLCGQVRAVFIVGSSSVCRPDEITCTGSPSVSFLSPIPVPARPKPAGNMDVGAVPLEESVCRLQVHVVYEVRVANQVLWERTRCEVKQRRRYDLAAPGVVRHNAGPQIEREVPRLPRFGQSSHRVHLVRAVRAITGAADGLHLVVARAGSMAAIDTNPRVGRPRPPPISRTVVRTCPRYLSSGSYLPNLPRANWCAIISTCLPKLTERPNA